MRPPESNGQALDRTQPGLPLKRGRCGTMTHDYKRHGTTTLFAVQAWLAKHPRVHVHFTPTSGSWLNMVERLFRDLTENRIRRGVFRSVDELESAIHDYLAKHNAEPKPFIWSATHADILGKVARAKAAMLGQPIR